MERYVHAVPLLFSCFLYLCCHQVFCQLSSNQTETMLNLSMLLNGTETSWGYNKDPKNPCKWKGVSCGFNDSYVIGVSLPGLSLSTPEIYPVICKIDTLESLDLSNNKLGLISDEFISGCGMIGGLKMLNFSRNRLGGSLPDFDGFVGLEVLDLAHNQLNGNIGSQFDSLVRLKSLNISSNMFNGSVHIHFGASKALQQLLLSDNHFEGMIPEEIFSFRNLTHVDLSENSLSGIIPDRIGELYKLEVLVLSSNNFVGDIPRTLPNMSSLIRFAAYQNKLTGDIPLGLTRSLKSLDLSYNKLGGLIPSDLLSQPNLESVDLSYNGLKGSIPADLSPSLVRLRLGSNQLTGVIPDAMLRKLGNLTYLELENNRLSGKIPPQLGLCKNLALLNLAMNNLSGAFPVELGNLSSLQVMKLQSNKLYGVIPPEIAKLHRLSILNISSNMFNGSIPPQISSLQNLTNLYLQGNNLSGPIPATINNLSSLLELQLGHNQLRGEIPTMPSKLQIALNLSSNHFDGPIPRTFSTLGSLEVLDLSNNRFSGEVPSFLNQMKSLIQLILSNNLLYGELPEFDSRVAVDTTGNKLTNANRNPPSESTKKKKSASVTIIVSVTAAVVAVGIVTVIVFSISRCYCRVNDDQIEPTDEPQFPRVIEGNLLTSNGIHRLNIDFTKAMETVAQPLNISLKTRFSTYYKTPMPSGACYFVKKLNWSDKIFQLGNRDKFDHELEVLGRLSNSNVMTPLAYVLTVDSAYIFYEFAQKGTLYDVLHGSSRESLDWASRYSISIGVAQGLAFLHGCTSGPILLLDLSSRNIFLRSLKEPLVGDIELCKVIDPTKSTGSLSTIAGSVGYIAPEYAYTMRVTMAGNVYSFGVVLLELLTGKPAVDEGNELAKWALSNSAQKDTCDHILDPSISKTVAARSQMLAILKVALSCVSLSPDARPKMKSVLRMLLTAR